MTSVGTPALWVIFAVAVAAMLALDLGVFHRKAHKVSLKEAGIWSLVWVTLALGFGALVALRLGGDAAQTYYTGYILEKALSVDNLFVFFLIFSAFKVQAEHQHRLLFWGIVGALVLRTGMIFGGAWLLSHFHVLAYVFGAVLIVTGVRMFRRDEHDSHPERGRMFRLVSRLLPTSTAPHGGHLLVRESGALKATSLLLVLVLVELSDVVFAVDSILAVFAVTEDPFLILTSNVFAILGMRSLYFLLAGVAERFVYLQPGLALVIIFVGVKMAVARWVHVPVLVSLLVISVVLTVAVVASLLRTRGRGRRGLEGGDGVQGLEQGHLAAGEGQPQDQLQDQVELPQDEGQDDPRDGGLTGARRDL
jgi:tellurite resistance protein TerC